MNFRHLFLLLFLVMLNGCILYVPDVEQGNIVTEEMISQVKPGQTRQQVRFILGSPLVRDPFHASRWDYFYSIKKGRNEKLDTKRLTIIFKGDRVDRVLRNG